MYRIFIVEDDEVISRSVAQYLARWGFETAETSDFQNVMAQFDAFEPQLVIMDVSLPYYSGYYWCAKMRENSKAPIVFLSSRTDTADVVMAIGAGADDYVTKPFDPELLVAKVQAALRRAYDYEPLAANARVGEATFDAANACLLIGETRVELTRNESRILALLLEKRGRIATRDELMLKLWDSDEFIDDNTLTVNVNRLRKTLMRAGLGDRVRTHKGRGYSLDA